MFDGKTNDNTAETSMSSIIDFVIKNYHVPLRSLLPELIWLAGKVEKVHASEASCPNGLCLKLKSLFEDLNKHLSKEEDVLFPLVKNRSVESGSKAIQLIQTEHETFEDSLVSIRTLTFDLKIPAKACETWKKLYAGLEKLEFELSELMLLEENIFFTGL